MTATNPKARTATRAAKKAASSASGGILTSARDLASQVEGVASKLVDSVPDAADAVKDGALDAWSMVESMPTPQRNKMASISLAIGAGLYFLGAPRLLTFLAFLPAAAVGGARLARRLGRS